MVEVKAIQPFVKFNNVLIVLTQHVWLQLVNITVTQRSAMAKIMTYIDEALDVSV